MSYLFAHGEHAFTPDGKVDTPPADVDATNRETSRREVEAFKHDKPDRYFAYIGRVYGPGTAITTWMGDPLGRIIGQPRNWCSNFGDRRASFQMRAITGDLYACTAYLSAGDYCRLRKLKG